MFDTLKYVVTRKRLLLIGVGCAALLIIIIIVVAVIAARGKKEPEYASIIDRIVDLIDSENIRKNVEYFAKEPHPAGGKRNLELGAEILKRWKSYGLDDVFENDYNVLLSLPTEESYIKYNGMVQYKPKYNEGTNSIPPFNAYAKNAKVSGQVVYVNFGRVEDFEKLVELGVDLNSKIALCRYGKIFRGNKVQNAFENGMIGMILYNDPADSGSGKGEVYPDGPWLPDDGVQRGTVMQVKGDVSTHLYPSYFGGYHASGEELAEIAPKIPVIPIPYNDVKPLHALIESESPAIPEDWGSYKIGPSIAKIELNVKTNDTLALCRNIIGVINGEEEPDRWVIIGTHRDTWMHGAVEPVSGMATMLEMSRSIGELLKTGWRPRRTIIFASWDAEESGVVGSFEFVEDFMTALKHKTVAYINMDSAGTHPHLLNMKSTPNLVSLLYGAAKETESPKPDYKTMYDFWIGAEKEHNKKEYTKPPVELIGSGGDYTAFLNEVGISCIDFGYKTNYGTYPVYHTQYDTYQWLSTYGGDQDFMFHKRLGDFGVRVLLSLATAEVLPLSASDYASKVKELAATLISQNPEDIIEHNLDVTGMMVLSELFESSAIKFEDYIKEYSNETDEDGALLRIINDKLMLMERQFIYVHGLPGRPSFRHLIFAPSSTNTYAGSAFPGIGDELMKTKGGKSQQQIGLITSKLEAVIRSIDTKSSL